MPFTLSVHVAENINNLNSPDNLDNMLEIMETSLTRQKTRRRYRAVSFRVKVACSCLAFFLSLGMAVFFIASSSSNRNSSSKTFDILEPFVLPGAPDELVSKCNMTVLGSSIKECTKLCEVAECCNFPATLALSCLTGNEYTCLNYHASCHILNDPTDGNSVDVQGPFSIPSAPQNLNELCNASNLMTAPGFQLCSEACLSAQCCYDAEVSPSCTNDHQECQDYAPCLALSSTDYVHQDIVTEVQGKCSEDNVQNNSGWNECENVCSQAVCCFLNNNNSNEDGDDACSNQDSNDWCSQYETCKNVMLGNDDFPKFDDNEPDKNVYGSYFIPDDNESNENESDENDDGSYFIQGSTSPKVPDDREPHKNGDGSYFLPNDNGDGPN